MFKVGLVPPSLRSEEASINSSTQQFTIADPRAFDGNPFEVAERAALQAQAVTKLLASAAEGAYIMARNAELERQLIASNECDSLAWEESAQNRRWGEVLERLALVEKDLAVLVKAAAFNPKGKLDG